MKTIKLISVNIEGSKHLPEIEELILTEKPDVVCLQELFEVDLPKLQHATGMQGSFSVMTKVSSSNKYEIPPNGLWGLGILSKWPFSPVENYFYRGEEDSIPEFVMPNSVNRLLMHTDVDVEGSIFPIANTHFTWSVGGKVTEEQGYHFQKLRRILAEFDKLILCGDFNTQRGAGLYEQFASMYQDSLPPEVDTTIDPVLHYAGGLKLVVDAVFASSHFQVLSARTQDGVSDHKALIVEVATKSE